MNQSSDQKWSTLFFPHPLKKKFFFTCSVLEWLLSLIFFYARILQMTSQDVLIASKVWIEIYKFKGVCQDTNQCHAFHPQPIHRNTWQNPNSFVHGCSTYTYDHGGRKDLNSWSDCKEVKLYVLHLFVSFQNGTSGHS